MAVSWLKKGAESAKVAQQEAVAAEQRKAEQGKMWRFYLKEGEEARITFVDGDLSPEGFLLPPRFYEHNLFLNNSWNNLYVCPHMTNPDSGEACPICEGGDRPALVALFTIIDHRVVKGKENKTYTNTPRIMAAKSQSFEMLNKLAIKRGGLEGCTFDVSRMGDKSASIGSMFDFVEKTPVAELQKKYTRVVKGEDGKEKTVSIFVPANYEEEIIFRSAAELRDLGFGKPATAGGSPSGFSAGGQQAASGQSYGDHL